MSRFQVGDRVRCLKAADYSTDIVLEKGREYTVIEADPLNVDNGDGGYGGWDESRFELVTPASAAQATEILDKREPRDVFADAVASQIGWWDVPSDQDGGWHVWRDHALSFGLEVRVQVRRAVS